MKSACVIGGGGFLGTALRSTLSARGYRLLTVGRRPHVHTFPFEQYFSLNSWTLKQLEPMLRELEPDALIDLSHNSVPNMGVEPVQDVAQNLANVIRHLELASSVRARLFVYVSSGGTVYGDGLHAPCSEEARTDPISPYGIGKLASEKFVQVFERQHGLRSAILRPSNIYGPGQIPFRGQGLVATALALAWRGDPIRVFGTGSHVRDYLYSHDFCRAVLSVVEHPNARGVFNVGSGEGVSINELLQSMTELLARQGRTLFKEPVPERPLDVSYSVLDSRKLANVTGWAPEVSIGDGIAGTWEWVQRYMAKLSS